MTLEGDTLFARNLPGASARRSFRLDRNLAVQQEPRDMEFARAAGATLAWLQKDAGDSSYTLLRGAAGDVEAAGVAIASKVLAGLTVQDAAMNDDVYAFVVGDRDSRTARQLVRVDLRTGETSWRPLPKFTDPRDFYLRGIALNGIVFDGDGRIVWLRAEGFSPGLPPYLTDW